MPTIKLRTAPGFVLAAVAAALVLFTVGCGGGRPEAEPVAVSESAEFTPLFDGQTLAGWRGDQAYWSVRDGAITGGSAQPISINTFLIHEGTYRNFELRFKYRFPIPGNSGLQFRSRMHPAHEFAVAGYQANVVTVPPSTNERFAMLYEERDRTAILAASGEQTIVTRGPDGSTMRELVRAINPRERVMAAEKKYPEWNEQVVIAWENRMVNALNGVLTADTTDNDVEARAFEGFIALQVHSGPPMEVQYKDIEIRPLTAEPDFTGRFIVE